ncbi:MAG: hypothetical protein AAGF67_14035, partial [Verrucomicrobiota bacterium]
MNEGTEKQLLDWCGKLCDETITDEEFARLDELLQSDEQARKAYRSYLEMHQQLGAGALEKSEPEQGNVTPFPLSKIGLALAAAASVLIGFFLNQWTTTSSAPESETAPDFVLTRAIDVEWEHPTRFQAKLGEPIRERHLRIKSGIAQIQFASGAVATIEGPAKFRLDNPMHCFNHYGKLAVYCPESAYGFIVRFPGGRITDLGTEFALDSEPEGKTKVHVLDGEIIVARTDEEDQVLREKNLTGRSAVSIGDEIESIEYDEEPFSDLTRDSLARSQPLKLQFDLGHRAGLYQGTNSPAHNAGDMASHESHWTQIIGDQSGTFVMADGNLCEHPIRVDYGHGDGEIDWDAEPVDPWGQVYSKAEGIFNTALCQDHRPWDFDLGLRVSGLPAGTYRIYALCRSVRRAEAFYEVGFGTNMKKLPTEPIEIPPMDPDKTPKWEQGVTYEAADVVVEGPEDWATFITRYSRERSLRSTPHHGRSV